MDQLYFLDGYYEGNYFVYTADVIVGFTPYIADDYLNQDFFEDRGSSASVVCEGTRLRIILADAALTSSFAQTTTANKDARTSITLSTIASLAAQNDKIRFYSAEINSTATQTAHAQKTARATIALTSAFAPVITANASVSNGSNFATNFTLTASSGITRQFPVNRLTGAATSTTTSYYPQVLDFDQAQFDFGNPDLNIRDINWTFGIWVKRESRSSSGYYETIATSTLKYSSANWEHGAIAFRGDNIRFRFNEIATGTGATWSNVAPNNTDWHHYLFRSINTNNNQPVNNWQLWVDGVYQGVSTSFQSAGDQPWAGKYGSEPTGFQYLGGLSLGQSLLFADDGTGPSNAPLNGAFAQPWMGRVTDAQFDPNKFWNTGAIDLGATGVSTGLPTPIFYNRLSQPYTGVTWAPDNEVVLTATAPLILPSVQARFTLTCDVVTVIENTVAVQSVASVSVSGTRVLVLAATITAESTQSALAVKTARATETLTSTATFTASAEKLRGVSAGLTATATVSATAFKVKQFECAVAAAFTFTASALRTRTTSSSLTATATFTATIDDRTRDAITLQAGSFTLNITYTRVKFGAGAITATATTATAATAIKRAVGTQTSQFTQTADAQKVVITTANFASQFTIASTVFRAIIAQANLSANGFVLTQGDILNFDPCREIGVEEETRLARLLPESRLLIVDEETRTLRVPQETRVLGVDYETRVNIIKC